MDTRERTSTDEVVHSTDFGMYFGEWDNLTNQAHGYGVRVWGEGRKITEGY